MATGSTGLPGADSYDQVTSELVKLAKETFNANPAFWGRYFTSIKTTSGAEYRHLQENSVLAQWNIRLLPIARQTANVGGSSADGAADATNNAQDFIDTFGNTVLSKQGKEFLMFLDVENGTPSLSLDYYTGWAQTLKSYSLQLTNRQVTIQPCVYGNHSDTTTWSNLVSAVNNGVPCQGAWIARYYRSGCQLQPWDNSIVSPSIPLPFDVLIWQYAQNCAQGQIDCDQSNPAIDVQAQLLSKLVLPPA
jgi:hypothetical protein